MLATKICSNHPAAAHIYFLACVNDFCHFYSEKKIWVHCFFIVMRCSNKSAISSYNSSFSQHLYMMVKYLYSPMFA